VSNYADADLATDDAAFRAAQDAVRKAERERDRRRQQERLAAEAAAEKARREALAEKYPSTVSDKVYDLAEQIAYDHHADYLPLTRLDEEYGDIVSIVNEAIKNRDFPCPSCEEIITGSQPVCPYCGYVVVSS
jgi:hypothetical protein